METAKNKPVEFIDLLGASRLLNALRVSQRVKAKGEFWRLSHAVISDDYFRELSTNYHRWLLGRRLTSFKKFFPSVFPAARNEKKEDLRFVHVCSISLYLYKTSSWPFPARKFYKSATYVASAVCFRLEIVVIDFPFKIVADPMHIWKCWQATSWENIGNCFVLVRIAVVDLL